MFAEHVVISSEGRVTLCLDEAELLTVTRALARVGRGRLLSFCAVDDHVHALVVPGQGRLFARDLRFALQRHVRPGLHAFVKPVRERAHFQRLLAYVLEQPRKHALQVHPAAWPGSCFPDLVGARRLPGFDAQLVNKLLPRFQLGTASAAVGLAGVGVLPATAEDLFDAGVKDIALAGAAAIGDVTLVGKQRERVAGRVAVIELGLSVGFRPSDLADALGIAGNSLRRLRGVSAEAPLLDAVRRQARLRRLVLGTTGTRRA